MMKSVASILVLTLMACVLLTDAMVKQVLEARDAPDWMSYRAKPVKRHYVDPIIPASSIYATMVQVGGRNYRVIMDTGSGTLFLIGRNCTMDTSAGCEYATNFYPYSGGSASLVPYTFNECGNNAIIEYDGVPSVCRLSANYADGSFVYAAGVSDQSTIGPYSGSVKIGMAYYTSDDFVLPGTDGIWGMTRPSNAFVGVPGPLEAAINDGMPAVFAMCLLTTNGELHLGGYDYTYSSSDIKWFNYVGTQYHYVLTLAGMSVSTTSLAAASSTKVIFDSGSTISYFPSTLFSQILAAISSACGACNTGVFVGSVVTTDPTTWPTITISFTDASAQTVNLALSGSQYLRHISGNTYTGGFQETGDDDALFGVSFMRQWYTIFHIANGQIGIGTLNAAKCVATLTAAPGAHTISPSTPLAPNPPFSIIPAVSSTGPQAETPSTPTESIPTGSPPDTTPSGSPPSGSPPSNPSSPSPSGTPSNMVPSEDTPSSTAQAQSSPFATSILLGLILTLLCGWM